MPEFTFKPQLTNLSYARDYVFNFSTDGYSSTGGVLPTGAAVVTSAGDGYYTCTLPVDFPVNSIIGWHVSLRQAATNSNDAAYLHSVDPVNRRVGIVTQSAAGTAAQLSSPATRVSVVLKVSDKG